MPDTSAINPAFFFSPEYWDAIFGSLAHVHTLDTLYDVPKDITGVKIHAQVMPYTFDSISEEECRDQLYNRAKLAIANAKFAGWMPLEFPEITITGKPYYSYHPFSGFFPKFRNIECFLRMTVGKMIPPFSPPVNLGSSLTESVVTSGGS
jgi:hypothetical protein